MAKPSQSTTIFAKLSLASHHGCPSSTNFPEPFPSMLRAEREVGKESKQQKSRDTHLTSGHCSGLLKLVCL